MEATKLYIEHHGKPVALYSDKHTVFRVNKRSAVGGNGMTQYGRALHELGIQHALLQAPCRSHKRAPPHDAFRGSRWIFTWQEQRTLSASLTLQYDKVLYLIEPSPENQRLAGKRVLVIDYPDGKIKIRYEVSCCLT